MNIEAADRIKNIGSYAFADVDNEVAKLKKAGITPIDFGVGDPREPTPGNIRNYLKRAVDKRKEAGYPSYTGSPDYRETIAKWTKERFNVSLDENKEICSLKWINTRNRFSLHILKSFLDCQRKYLFSGRKVDLKPLTFKKFLTLYPFHYLDQSRLSRLIRNLFVMNPQDQLIDLRDLFISKKISCISY